MGGWDTMVAGAGVFGVVLVVLAGCVLFLLLPVWAIVASARIFAIDPMTGRVARAENSAPDPA